MSPDPFDEIDRALASGLSALAPEVEGGDEALDALRPHFRRARTRSRAMKIGGSIAAVLLVGSAAAVAAPRSQRTHVSVSSAPTTVEKPRKHHARPSTTTTPTTKARPTTTTTVTSPPQTGGTNHRSTGSATPPPPLVVFPTTPPTSPPTKPVTGTTTTTKPKPKPSSGAVYKTFSSKGGTIRVRLYHGKMRLVRGPDPVPGYHAWLDRYEPTDIIARFSNGHSAWRIRVRVKNGVMVEASGPSTVARYRGRVFRDHQQYFQTQNPSRGVLSPFVPTTTRDDKTTTTTTTD